MPHGINDYTEEIALDGSVNLIFDFEIFSGHTAYNARVTICDGRAAYYAGQTPSREVFTVDAEGLDIGPRKRPQ